MTDPKEREIFALPKKELKTSIFENVSELQENTTKWYQENTTCKKNNSFNRDRNYKKEEEEEEPGAKEHNDYIEKSQKASTTYLIK